MSFIARFSRREAGGYDCSYGKGSRQLTAVMEKIDGKWKIVDGFATNGVESDPKISVVKEGWAALAASSYGTGASPETVAAPTLPVVPSRPGPPSLRKSAPEGTGEVKGASISTSPAGPPSLRGVGSFPKIQPFPTPELAPEGASTCPHCHMPFNGWTWQTPPEDSREHKRLIPPCRCNEANTAEYAPDLFDARMYRRGADGKFTVLTEMGVLDMIYHWALRNKEYVVTDGKLDSPWKEAQEVLWRDCGYSEYRPEIWA